MAVCLLSSRVVATILAHPLATRKVVVSHASEGSRNKENMELGLLVAS